MTTENTFSMFASSLSFLLVSFRFFSFRFLSAFLRNNFGDVQIRPAVSRRSSVLRRSPAVGPSSRFSRRKWTQRSALPVAENGFLSV